MHNYYNKDAYELNGIFVIILFSIERTIALWSYIETNHNSQDRFHSEFRVENKITLLSHLFLFRLCGFVRVISDEIAMGCKEKFPFRITITIPSSGKNRRDRRSGRINNGYSIAFYCLLSSLLLQYDTIETPVICSLTSVSATASFFPEEIFFPVNRD